MGIQHAVGVEMDYLGSIDKGDVEQIRNEQPAKKFAATGRVGPRVLFVSGCSCVARMGGPAGDVVGDAVKVAADVDAQFQVLGDFQVALANQSEDLVEGNRLSGVVMAEIKQVSDLLVALRPLPRSRGDDEAPGGIAGSGAAAHIHLSPH